MRRRTAMGGDRDGGDAHGILSFIFVLSSSFFGKSLCFGEALIPCAPPELCIFIYIFFPFEVCLLYN